MQTGLFLRAGLYRYPQYAQQIFLWEQDLALTVMQENGILPSLCLPSLVFVLSLRPEVKGRDKLIKVRPFWRLASRRLEKGGLGEGAR